MRIAITGHRPNKLGNDYSTRLDQLSPLLQWIRAKIELIIVEQKADMLISGMALGVDMLFAKIGVSMERPFTAAVPFKGQEVIWPQHSQLIYQLLLSKAHEVVYVSPEYGYSPHKMQLRNQWMVDNCDLLIAVWDGTSGGTANCVRYAEIQGRKIIRINPKEYEQEKEKGEGKVV